MPAAKHLSDEHIGEALLKARGQLALAAHDLKISPRTLARRLRESPIAIPFDDPEVERLREMETALLRRAQETEETRAMIGVLKHFWLPETHELRLQDPE